MQACRVDPLVDDEAAPLDGSTSSWPETRTVRELHAWSLERLRAHLGLLVPRRFRPKQARDPDSRTRRTQVPHVTRKHMHEKLGTDTCPFPQLVKHETMHDKLNWKGERTWGAGSCCKLLPRVALRDLLEPHDRFLERNVAVQRIKTCRAYLMTSSCHVHDIFMS